jgi:hypothetical protein
VLLIVATAVLLLLHEPPDTELLNEVVPATHTVDVPEIVPASGVAFTVTTVVADTLPHSFVTV